MDQELLVENRVENGQRLLTELARSGLDVTVAFWVRTTEDVWKLYLGLGSFDPRRDRDAYRRLFDCVRRLPEPPLSLMELGLTEDSKPVCVAAKAIRDRSPRMVPIQYLGNRLDGLDIKEAYIYPRFDLNKPVVLSVVRDVKVDLQAKRLTLYKKRVTLPPGTVVGLPFIMEYSAAHPSGTLSEKSIEDAIQGLPEGWTHQVVEEE